MNTPTIHPKAKQVASTKTNKKRRCIFDHWMGSHAVSMYQYTGIDTATICHLCINLYCKYRNLQSCNANSVEQVRSSDINQGAISLRVVFMILCIHSYVITLLFVVYFTVDTVRPENTSDHQVLTFI